MLGVAVNRVALGDLDHFAEIHDRHSMADMFDDAQVVGDEQISQMHLLLQLLQQIDDLRLNRNIEGRHRLIADDKLGTDRQGAGDADALALAAAEFMRDSGGSGLRADRPGASSSITRSRLALPLASL